VLLKWRERSAGLSSACSPADWRAPHPRGPPGPLPLHKSFQRNEAQKHEPISVHDRCRADDGGCRRPQESEFLSTPRSRHADIDLCIGVAAMGAYPPAPACLPRPTAEALPQPDGKISPPLPITKHSSKLHWLTYGQAGAWISAQIILM